MIIIYSTRSKVITEKITENQTSRHIKSQNWIKRTGKLRTRCQTQKNVKSIKRNKYINERGTFNSNNKSLVDQSATIDHRPASIYLPSTSPPYNSHINVHFPNTKTSRKPSISVRKLSGIFVNFHTMLHEPMTPF